MPPDLRCAIRQRRAGPQLDDLKVWFVATLRRVSGKSELAAAIRYAMSRWEQLTRYCDDSRLEIDNNAADRAIRALVARMAVRRLRHWRRVGGCHLLADRNRQAQRRRPGGATFLLATHPAKPSTNCCLGFGRLSANQSPPRPAAPRQSIRPPAKVRSRRFTRVGISNGCHNGFSSSPQEPHASVRSSSARRFIMERSPTS